MLLDCSYTLSCLIYHPKFAHDPYYLPGTEKLTALSLPVPACAPANLLSFSSILLFLLIAIIPLCKCLCHSWNLANPFCMKYSGSGKKRGEDEERQKHRKYFRVTFFSPTQNYHCSVLLWCCPCSYSPQGNIYKAFRTHSNAVTLLLILSVTSRVLSSSDIFSGYSQDRTEVLRGCGNRLLHVFFFSREKKSR